MAESRRLSPSCLPEATPDPDGEGKLAFGETIPFSALAEQNPRHVAGGAVSITSGDPPSDGADAPLRGSFATLIMSRFRE